MIARFARLALVGLPVLSLLASCASSLPPVQSISGGRRDSTSVAKMGVPSDLPGAQPVPAAPGDSAKGAVTLPDTVAVDTSHVRVPLPAPAVAKLSRGTPEGPTPPLQFTADNMSGTRGPDGDEVVLHGNLRITRGRTVLTSDDGRYLHTPRMLYMDGHVKLVDSTTTVTCDHASFSENDDRLGLAGNVVVHDRNAVLRAPSGIYDRKRGIADLFGGVQGQDDKQRVLADRAVYDRDSLVLRARGHVRGFDDANRIELDADSVDYDRRSKWAEARGNPLMRVKDEDGKPAEIRALRMRVNSETRYAEAIDSVRVERDTLRARADLGRFDDVAGRGWLTGNPVAWDNETRVSGDTLELWTEARRLRRVVVRRNAAMEYAGARPGAQGETSRLTGERVDAFVTGNSMDSLVAVGGARNQYSAVPKAGQTAENNVAKGDTITVYFKDRKVDRARVQGNATGEYHPGVDVSDTAAVSKEVIVYDAKRIEFEVPRSRIVLDHDAHLTYRDLALKAKRVEFDVEKQTLVANGSPELVDRGDKVEGNLMTYDLSTRVGTIYQAETAYERGLYRGEAIRKVSNNELDVKHGDYTTCQLDQPHYHFAASWMKIYLKDKMVAKPVVLYVKNVPVLALPFWIFPIKPGRHSGFLFPQVEFGLNNQAGQFVRNAGYYWATNDYTDFQLTGDYYQAEPSWVIRGEGNYKLLYVLDGQVRGSFAHNDRLQTDDYDINAQHYQELSPNTHITGQGSFVSSRSYSSSALYGRTLEQRTNRFLTSSIALSHHADWASIDAVVARSEDLDADASIADPDGQGPLHGAKTGTQATSFDVQSSTPTISLAFPTRTLGSMAPLRGTSWEKAFSTLYFGLDTRFVETRQRQSFVARQDTFRVNGVLDSSSVLDQSTTIRRAFGSSLALSDSRRPFGFLNLAPRFNADFAVFDYDEAGNRLAPAASWNAGVSTSTTMYGTFRTRIGPLVGLRHSLFPSASFSYAPEIKGHTFVDANGVTHPRFTSVGGIGVSSFRQAFLTLGLDQRLQAKLRHGDNIQRLDNLVSLSMRSSYNMLWQQQHQQHPFSPISTSLQIQPPGTLSFSLSSTVDPYEGRPMRNLSFYSGYTLQKGQARISTAPALPTEQTSQTSSAGFAEDWSVQFAYSYSGGYGGPVWTSAQTLNAVGHYQFSPGWALEYSTQVDLVSHRVGTQRFVLSRDLHCWTASFTRVFTQGGEAEYYFRLSVKELRELYVERGTRTGSLGGIQ